MDTTASRPPLKFIGPDVADLPRRRSNLRACPTAAAAVFNDGRRRLSDQKPIRKLDHLSHRSFPAASASFDKKQIGRGVMDEASFKTDE
jgi:hypothetical protein